MLDAEDLKVLKALEISTYSDFFVMYPTSILKRAAKATLNEIARQEYDIAWLKENDKKWGEEALRLQSKMNELEAQDEASRAKISELEAQIVQLNCVIASNRQAEDAYRHQLTGYCVRVDKLEKRIIESGAQIYKLGVSKEIQNHQINDYQKQIAKLERELAKAQVYSSDLELLHSLNDKIAKLEAQVAQNEHALAVADTQAQMARRRLDEKIVEQANTIAWLKGQHPWDSYRKEFPHNSDFVFACASGTAGKWAVSEPDVRSAFEWAARKITGLTMEIRDLKEGRTP